ncbi:MAG: hypothetical protein HN742_02000 [Lentisphaerae bacterium]|jgi:lysophospholipase L1-like esterase|nr:hypothetical protein [Lentisphaerota bacterium]MBT4817087.1 hypothetical protein [Lentisphaerota bacterium]MBT5612381.1 hypothetical protein [Lentisphaerota bacterium]MBT7056685.1 hypothetical protein [Lentisphaerota bacterium]MBT7840610.1 hypothetical protein [Lentisphaerota bacterium]
MKLVIFGSSVAGGAGAENSHGWAAMLKAKLEQREWTVVNRSIGGDNTTKLMARFESDLLPEKPDMVILALSLGNEGIMGEGASVYRQYVRNMHKLVQMCRKNQIIPIVSNCYPNGNYEPEHHDYLRRFNETLNTWSVASIDFLGAIDDGHGRWPEGTWTDAGHPNSLGHAEMFQAIPLSLFDHLIDEHYQLPQMAQGGLQCGGNAENACWLSYTPDSPMHSFSLAFRAQPSGTPEPGAVIASCDGCRIAVGVSGHWELQLADGAALPSAITAAADQAYEIGLTHSYTNRELALYINGTLVGKLPGRLLPEQGLIGGGRTAPGPQGLYQRVLIYRSCLDAEAMESLAKGNVLRSSLELYAPLNDATVRDGVPLTNHAQTGAEMVVLTGSRDK